MIIPDTIVKNKDTMIVHIIRDDKEFAESFLKISRQRVKSFIAHNFIPFWQLGVYPLENILNKKILDKYIKINKIKNDYFYRKYSINPNYKQVTMGDIFKTEDYFMMIADFIEEKVKFSKKELSIKSN